jgi:hypothetical protein
MAKRKGPGQSAGNSHQRKIANKVNNTVHKNNTPQPDKIIASKKQLNVGLEIKPTARRMSMWNYIDSWVLLSIIGPGLIALGFGVLSMTPPQVKFSLACHALGYLLILMKVSRWVAFERTEPPLERGIFIALIFGATGALWFGSSMFAIAQGRVEHRQPFTINLGTTFISPVRESSMLWATNYGSYGTRLSPIHLAQCVTLTNAKYNPTMIAAFSIDVLGVNDKWVLMRKMDINRGPIYWVSGTPEHPNAASVSFGDGSLMDSVSNRSFGVGESARGWVLYGAPEGYDAFPKPHKFRIRIKDMVGDEVIQQIDHSENQSENTQYCKIDLIPSKIDIKAFHIWIFGD